jgi:hypothetical protein
VRGVRDEVRVRRFLRILLHKHSVSDGLGAALTKQEIADATARLCSVLTGLGFEYHFEADNRGGNKSHYIYVRRPIYMEIRISDHPMNKIKRRKRFDIGPHGISLDQAIEQITELAKS